MSLSIDQLEIIETIVEKGSFRAAAQSLKKSQPSLSVGIKKVEDFYGFEIFSREGYRPELTEKGRHFYNYTKATLGAYRKLDLLGRQISIGMESHIDISMDPLVSLQIVQPVLDELFQTDNQTILNLQSDILFSNAQKLLRKEVDFAIGQYPIGENQDIECIKIYHVKLKPVIHENCLDCNNSFSSQELEKIPNIVVGDKSQKGLGSESMATKWFVSNHARKFELITMGYGWGRLSEQEIVMNPWLTPIKEDILPCIEFDVFFMRNKTMAQGPVAQRVWDKLLKANL